jgi:ABC-type amino acid transport substrate-binding protein
MDRRFKDESSQAVKTEARSPSPGDGPSPDQSKELEMSTPKLNRPSIVAISIAVLALVLSLFSLIQRPQGATPAQVASNGLLSTLDRDRVIRAGYGVFPPFTVENPTTGQVSGISVDIVEEMARQVGARVEWKRMNWNTMGAELRSGAFDMVADPIFMTPQRGREFTFTEPYSYFAIGIGVVRTGDGRFHGFDDINQSNVSVAVGQGTGEEAFVRARAPRANLLSIPIGQDTASQINAVLTGRADIAIVNVEDARRFVGAHRDRLIMLWADNPPAYVPAGFILRMGDTAGADFLNVSIRNLRSTGVLRTIGARHGTVLNMEEPGLVGGR